VRVPINFATKDDLVNLVKGFSEIKIQKVLEKRDKGKTFTSVDEVVACFSKRRINKHSQLYLRLKDVLFF
jgi:DNA uptake protein ComE-like DNA-binding protein